MTIIDLSEQIDDICRRHPGTPTRPSRPGGLPTPPPRPENLLSDCTENCPLRPCEHPGGFGIRKSASNSGHSPLAALHFLPPTGHENILVTPGHQVMTDSRSGRRSFDSKLISLLPLDEVPVHVPLRRPRPLRFERLRVGGEGKADANLTHFF